MINGLCKILKTELPSMRPKARGLAHHGVPPGCGWLGESDPTGCDFVRDEQSIPPVLTEDTTWPV